jgi:hypothetical protein
MVIGLTIFQDGAVGAAYLVAVFISNVPNRSPRLQVSSPAVEEGAHPLDGSRSR